jgi:hypothetical protein
MKRMLVFVIALFTFGQLSATAVHTPFKPDSPMGISVMKRGSVIQLFYRAEQPGKVKVAIYNHNGRVVFREVLRRTDEFMRPYNFSHLPEGTYTIEIDDVSGKRYKTVEHRHNREQRIAHLTRLREDPSRYVLLVPNKGSEVLRVRILDENNRVLYRKVQSIDGDFAGLYNIKKANGTYVFEVTDSEGRATRLSKP